MSVDNGLIKMDRKISEMINRRGAKAAREAESLRRLETKSKIVLGSLLLSAEPTPQLKEMFSKWGSGIRKNDQAAWEFAMSKFDFSKVATKDDPSETEDEKTSADVKNTELAAQVGLHEKLSNKEEEHDQSNASGKVVGKASGAAAQRAPKENAEGSFHFE